MHIRNLLFKLLKASILILIVFKSLQLLVTIYVIIALARVIHGNESVRTQFSYIGKEFEAEHLIGNIIVISFLILLSVWLFQKYREAHTVSRFRLAYKPIWALFSFVIPIFNFVAPYKIMGELWQVKNGDMPGKEAGKTIIKTWWILSVIVIIATRYLRMQANEVKGLDEFLSLESYYLFLYAVSIHYYLVSRNVVRMIGN